jgi:hypothetical protein
MHWNDDNEVLTKSIVSQIKKDIIDREKHFVLPFTGHCRQDGMTDQAVTGPVSASFQYYYTQWKVFCREIPYHSA